MDPNLIISILALLISVISLGWNVWNKVKSEQKKIIIHSYKNGTPHNQTCVITLTNIGKKPIYIRRIEMHKKEDGKSKPMNINYANYRERFENIPLNPENWHTIILKEDNYLKFTDENDKYFETRITVIEPTGKKHRTKWFKQNNLR